ncbi:formyl transferase [Peteryoungia desertarenae]|uniref:Formyl transferase n=1 Tax=Peteryoungia desertarenae TaxID=1813451 RepID=A0ABX6QPP3_9HYPH|nr:formyl transferase [Peteryoungia desertarenae]QLF70505.1 formyl transferase [Peteryoungia desertarenae]
MTDTASQTRPSTVVLMTAGGLNPTLVANALAARGHDLHVLLEEPEGKLTITRRRARRLGWLSALGQLATMIAARLMRRLTNRRIAELLQKMNLPQKWDPRITRHQVTSINAPETRALVDQLAPGAILLVSTRLMSKGQLAGMPCPVLNLHAGINPAYRGQMGGYWSLVEGDRKNFGATVHLVDPGTDTGETLYEVRTSPARSDFISTYPLVLTIAALDITCRAVDDALSQKLTPSPAEGPSFLRFPPTFWSWIYHGVSKGIW